MPGRALLRGATIEGQVNLEAARTKLFLTLSLPCSTPSRILLSTKFTAPPVARRPTVAIMISASLARPRTVACRASKEAGASAKAVAAPKAASPSVVDRRASQGLVAGVAAVFAAPSDGLAAYGEAANVFGKVRGELRSEESARARER